jgi:RNA polymerase sigma-70 factor, ECF subfamily
MTANQGLTLASIYDQHFQFVWRVLRRLGVPAQDVRDAVQDVFVVVHRKLPEFRGDSKVTTWLFGICVRVARDRRRAAYVRREVVAGSNLGTNLSDGDGTMDVERREALRLLERIMDEMPLEQRVVFALFELEGESCETIAELVGAPLGTVYSRLRLARKAFHRFLARLQARDSFRFGSAGGAA